MTELSERLIGSSVAIRSLQDEIALAARSDAKVLITGESGSGKEVAALQIHGQSGRSRFPLVTINCAGIPESLLESELFGHERGSFTGAFRDRPGMLELAHRGTVFLDEVAEMSLRMQGLLLRFLETGEIQRVGAVRSAHRIDVRVIAATNRNLLDAIAAKTFRDDLYYRLNVIHLVIPSLRERREDVLPLLQCFLGRYSEQYGVTTPEVSAEATAHLVAYRWPGNVRELKNVVERLVVRGANGRISPEDLPAEISNAGRGSPVAADTCSAAGKSLALPVDVLLQRMVSGGESFWTVVYDPFISRDITRGDLRSIIQQGLEHTRGSYTLLVQLFNMDPGDYKRFLNFLRKHQCHMPFLRFRAVPVRLASNTNSKAAGVA